MSTANPPAESYECSDCHGPRTPMNTVDGSFCSIECRNRHRGRNLLQYLRNDHRICYTCFRQLKTVEKALPRMPECVIGFQYPTQHATRGQITEHVYVDFARIID